jgi:hypothetical protein
VNGEISITHWGNRSSGPKNTASTAADTIVQPPAIAAYVEFVSKELPGVLQRWEECKASLPADGTA